MEAQYTPAVLCVLLLLLLLCCTSGGHHGVKYHGEVFFLVSLRRAKNHHAIFDRGAV